MLSLVWRKGIINFFVLSFSRLPKRIGENIAGVKPQRITRLTIEKLRLSAYHFKMMQIENDYLSPSDFYAQLEKTVKERIEGLIVEVKTLEGIDRSRGLFGYEKAKMRACGRALKTNEDFMVFFNSDYLRFN